MANKEQGVCFIVTTGIKHDAEPVVINNVRDVIEAAIQKQYPSFTVNILGTVALDNEDDSLQRHITARIGNPTNGEDNEEAA